MLHSISLKTCTFMPADTMCKGDQTSHGGNEKMQNNGHDQRAIFSKGTMIKITKQKCRLFEHDLEALAKKSQP